MLNVVSMYFVSCFTQVRIMMAESCVRRAVRQNNMILYSNISYNRDRVDDFDTTLFYSLHLIRVL